MKLKMYWAVLIFSLLACVAAIYAIGLGINVLFDDCIFIGIMMILGGLTALLSNGYNALLLWKFIQNNNIGKKNENFKCYEFHRANMPQYGCTIQCDECFKKEIGSKKN